MLAQQNVGIDIKEMHNPHTSTKNTNLFYGLVNSPESRLFVVMVNPSVSMQYIDAVLLSRGTVTAIDAMIGAIVPLARKLQQEL